MKFLFQSFLCLSFFLLTSPAISQDITGIWKGSFSTNDGQQYKLEFQIDGSNKKPISGVSYSYGQSVSFYGKATMTGNYSKELKSFIISEIRTVEVKMASGGTCLMRYRFEYSKSGREEFLEGVYVAKSEDRNNPQNNGVWGDCGGGRVVLRRVQHSDFPLEPFLQKKQPQRPPVVQQPVTTPQKRTAAPPVTAQKKNTIPTTAQKKPASTQSKKPATTNTQQTPAPATVRARPKLDTIKNQSTTTTVAIKNLPAEKRVSIPITTRERKNELTKTLVLANKEVEIRLYDNGQVDNDTISLYLDGRLILANQRLSEKPITYKLKLDENNPEHTLVMVAENLGSIPPNTSLMIVQDGDKRYQVSITSTEQKNAMVRFRYQKAE